jgi:phosphonate transport system permease protein
MTGDDPFAKIKSGSRLRISIPMASLLGFFVLAIVSWASILLDGDSGFSELLDSGAWSNVWDFIGQLFGKGSDRTPAFLELSSWREALRLSLDTLAMSVLAIGFAATAVLLTFLPAARNVAFGELSGSRSLAGSAAFHIMRGVFVFTRGIPELLWAMLIVFILSPGILPGALALGLHNYGLLGKLSAEVVEDIDPRPARALRSAGASNLQMFLYGVLPQVLPQFMTYVLYRWEVIIRTTIVVGFVAAGGLGREFRLSMSWFQYDKVMLLLMCYLLLVLGVDLIAVWLRRLAR